MKSDGPLALAARPIGRPECSFHATGACDYVQLRTPSLNSYGRLAIYAPGGGLQQCRAGKNLTQPEQPPFPC